MTMMLIEAVVLMFVCFAIGAGLAWLLAVAIFPRHDEAFSDLEIERDGS